MEHLFNYIAQSHHTQEKLMVNKCGMGVYIGVHCIRELPYHELDEQTTSIVVPFSEIPELIQSLNKASSSWTKPCDHLPTHEQDCIVCRLVDGQCRVYQSQYYAGQIIQGFGDLDDGESFYDDVLYWMPVDMSSVYTEIEKELKNNETCNGNKKPK